MIQGPAACSWNSRRNSAAVPCRLRLPVLFRTFRPHAGPWSRQDDVSALLLRPLALSPVRAGFILRSSVARRLLVTALDFFLLLRIMRPVPLRA
jgi:hypothetical protein